MDYKLLYITIIISVFFSCSKDRDDVNPTISINSPIDMQQVNGGDVVQITGTIIDDQNIELITISLRDKSNNVVLNVITEKPDQERTKRYTLSTSFVFSDLHMATGEYDFNITVSDGENSVTKYIPILFKETLKERKGVFVIGNEGNFSSIYLLDDNYFGSFYRSMAGDFIGVAVDSYNQQLINAAQTVGHITAISTSSQSELWQLNVPGNFPTPYYMGFYYNNQNIYLGIREGGVQGYDKNGNPNFSTATNPGNYMESAFIHDDRYLVIEENSIVTTTSRNISLTLLNSGFRVQESVLNTDIIGMFSVDQNTIILIGNDASLSAEIRFYEVSSGGASSPFDISSLGKVDACLEVENGVYLVAANNNLTLVNIHSFSKLGYLSGISADRVWLDYLSDELYVAYGNLLTVFDYSARTVKGTYTHTEDIKEVLFWYNK